jgi:CRISPR/Cas system CSM-associated protein Csm3 (group 7 of RAMP superfamily)
MNEPWTKIYPIRHLARVTLEFKTSFHIGAGREGEEADAEVVRDANGLPAIPGSSLAGVLRAQMAAKQADDLFGFQNKAEGRGSRVLVSWGCIHDQHNKPVEGRQPADFLEKDAVLATAYAPTLRDHVRLGHRGAAVAGGKFDELAVCAGHRFTFELEFIACPDEDETWMNLLGCLREIRLGGKTRRGFGRAECVELLHRRFDLNIQTDFEAYRRHPARLRESSEAFTKIEEEELKKLAAALPDKSAITATLALTPRGFWFFGVDRDPEGVTDSAAVRDRRIRWQDKHGTVEEDLLLIPGSAIKGALAHRVAFHFNALAAGHWADDIQSEEEFDRLVGENNTAVQQLFGCIKSKHSAGQRGRVFIDDVLLCDEPQSQIVHHVGIDRFTGGARPAVLFDERALWKGQFTVRLTVEKKTEVTDPKVIKALQKTLDDLLQGRLQLGAGSGRGNGYCEGSIDWSDGREWINGSQP